MYYREQPERMYSLFDFTSLRMGPGIGLAVFKEAKRMKVRWEERYVHNRTYQGKVKTYPFWFLEDNFDRIYEAYLEKLDEENEKT